jgi:hypothetical protein
MRDATVGLCAINPTQKNNPLAINPLRSQPSRFGAISFPLQKLPSIITCFDENAIQLSLNPSLPPSAPSPEEFP